MFKLSESYPKLGYIVNLVVDIICLSIVPLFILKNHPFYGFIVGIILSVVINELLGAYWRPWRLISKK